MTRRFRTIDEMLEREPPTCTCDRCKHCCLIPCWGTPEQVRAIIDAGFGDRLSVTFDLGKRVVWILIPADKARAGQYAPPFSSMSAEVGGCTFWDSEGLCHLHNAGLKPAEGRLAHHDSQVGVGGDWLRALILKAWDSDGGRRLVVEWMARYQPESLSLHQENGNLPILEAL